jgi:hypothetical protein
LFAIQSALALLRQDSGIDFRRLSLELSVLKASDTTYTERYMWTPQENKEGYDKGSAMSYVGDREGG